MSRLCAKPTCSAVAVQWFDVAAAEQRVITRSRATPSTLALCEDHAKRFSAPDGWTIEHEAGVAQDASPSSEPDASPTIEDAPFRAEQPSRLQAALIRENTPRRRARKHDRDKPWFLALSADPADVEQPRPEPVPLLASAPGAHTNEPEPSVGSLLHRAFHGPDRDIDTERAESAERDTEADAACIDVELPFPPFDTERHAAVS